MAEVARKVASFQWAKDYIENVRKRCAWLVEMSDEELWNFVPPPEQLRAINVCIGHDCPVCGEEITRKGGHYPWIISREKPFKLQCPVCNNIFPTNDFKPWNTEGLAGKPETGERCVDNGLGWINPKDGRRYYFIPYYIFWQRWARDILGGMRDLAEAYLLTDDPVYARKCAVLLCKVASEYERFDYAKQVYHEGRFGIRGRIMDYIWSTGNDSTMALAYDAIFPALARDEGLAAFLKQKGIDDAIQCITHMLHIMVKDVMSGYVAGNMGAHQKTLCHLAIVLDNDDPAKGPTTKEMREWLMSGPGRVEDLLWNGFWREGLGGESSPGYSIGWCHSFYEIAALLPKIGVDIWSHPKLKKMADIGLDLTVAGKFCPSIGDCGSCFGRERVGWTPELLGRAFMHYRDARHAKALKLIGARSQDLWTNLFDEEAVNRVVAEQGTEIEFRTRNLGGYGLAILESGKEPHRRAVTLYYGDANGGHGHKDRLNIEMFAFDRPVLTEDGYPTPFHRPDFYDWRGANTYRHYLVMIDEAPHHNRNAGNLNTLVSAPGLQLADASAETVYPGVASLYRRTTALVDISEEQSYLLDIFRVRGGKQHDWCFHGPPFPEFTIRGGTPGPVQEKGTLAGEDVPFGAKPPQHDGSCGFQGLFHIQRMRPAGIWSASWRLPQEDVSLTMMMPAGCTEEVITAFGVPELVPNAPEKIQYVLARNKLAAEGKEETLFSRFIAVCEPHRGKPSIDSIELLRGKPAALETVGAVIKRGNLRDYIHSALNPNAHCLWETPLGSLEVEGEFALLTTDERGVQRAYLVNGTAIKLGDFVLSSPPPLAAKVVDVDFGQNAIILDTVVPHPEKLPGTVVIISNDQHKTSYTITSAKVEGKRTVLSFGDVLYIVGMGAVAAVDEQAHVITADRDLVGYGCTDAGRHQGRYLYNETKTKGLKIAAVQGRRQFVLEKGSGALDEIFTDADRDQRRLYWISDIGPGDTVFIPAVTSYTR